MNRRRKIGIALAIIVIITTGCIWYMVSAQQKEVKVFTATLAFPGSELEADNYMEDKIAELTGAKMCIRDRSCTAFNTGNVSEK